MPFLPVVERELRVASHQSKTWWKRLGFIGVGIGLFLVALTVGRFLTPAMLGQQVFDVLGGFAMVYALLLGPLTTVDALSCERREGTLGLLFLTRLRGYDVVLGKLCAASLDMTLGFIAAVPLLAVPFLLGGLDVWKFLAVSAGILTLGFVSLASGIFMSAICTSARVSLVLTLLLLGSITLLLPMVMSEFFHVGPGSPSAPYLLMFCPLYTMETLLGGPFRPAGKIFLNLGALQCLSWLLVLCACCAVRARWRTEPNRKSNRFSRWRHAFSRGRRSTRDRHRNTLLDRNPILWLEDRDRLQGRLMVAATLVAVTVWVIKHLSNPNRWPNAEEAVLWGLFGHYLFCLWIAIDAPRRLADDKYSGALELLLCTTMKPQEIVAGGTTALLRRYAAPLMIVLVLVSYSSLCVLGRPGAGASREFLANAIGAGMIVAPVQLWAFLRGGMHQGLRLGNSVKATIWTGVLVGVCPMATFVLVTILLASGGGPIRSISTVTLVFVVVHLAFCGYVIAAATTALLDANFRALATGSGSSGSTLWDKGPAALLENRERSQTD